MQPLKKDLVIATAVVGFFAGFSLIVGAFSRMGILLEKRKTSVGLQYLLGGFLLSIGWSIMIGPVFAYYMAIVCLFIAAIIPALVFKACIEPLCGPFVCTRKTEVRDVLDAINSPCAAIFIHWEKFCLWMVGASEPETFSPGDTPLSYVPPGGAPDRLCNVTE